MIDNRVTSMSYDGSAVNKTEYTYDALGRMTTRKVAGQTSTYAYTSGGYGTNSTTLLVSTITQPHIPFEYTYDNRGNITSEKRGELITTYEYDAIGQLTRVNDPHENATWVYSYDRGGNILSKTKYAYTTDDLGEVLETVPYVYGDANWKDKLTSYNGQAITYDAIGSPLSDGTWDYHWKAGRQLEHMDGNGKTVDFAYNHDGLRIMKFAYEINDVSAFNYRTEYTLSGTRIVGLTYRVNEGESSAFTQDVLHFFYDAQGQPAMVEFNGTMFTYLKNLQGDIIGILDSNGDLVVEYFYDAWGRPLLVSTLTTAYENLAHINPFRYRGYVYDEETGLYYLKSRYYSPTWSRFVNSDIQYGRIAEHLSHNLYTYCVNSPIMLVDKDGCVWVAGAYAPYYGYYHTEVQNWIVANNPSIAMEVITSTGRIDLYNTSTHEMYEVKINDPDHIAEGLIQLERYKSGSLPAKYGTTSLILPPDGTLNYEYPNTTVAVTVRQKEALILYSIKVSRKQKVVETIPIVVPEKQEEKSNSFLPKLGLVILAAAFCAIIPGPVDDGILLGALFA